MDNKKVNRNDIIYIIGTLMLSITFLFLFEYVNIVTIDTYIVTVMNIVLILVNMKLFFKYKYKSIILLVALTIFFLIANYFNNIAIGRAMGYINVIFLLLFFKYIKFTPRGKRIIFTILLLTYMVFLIRDKSIYNTNTVCILTYVFLILLDALLKKNKNEVFFILRVIIFLISLYIIIIFDGRTTIIATFLYMIISLLPNKVFKNKKFMNVCIILFLIASLLVIYIYIYMWKNSITFVINFSEKSFFSGRQRIWNELVIAFNKCNKIFGLGSSYTLKYHRNYNPHNSSLYVLVTYGIPCFILYFYLMFKLLSDMSQKIDNSYNKGLFSALICFLLIGFFETVAIDAVWHIYKSLIILLFYDKYSEWKIEKKYKNRGESNGSNFNNNTSL